MFGRNFMYVSTRYAPLRFQPTSSSIHPLVVFRYDFDNGGFGDCIKGMVATMQIAALAGCDFRVDFSRHPFGTALPLAYGIADIRKVPEDRIFNIIDWLTSSNRRSIRDKLLVELANGSLGAVGSVTAIQSNMAMSHELASAMNVSIASVVGIASQAMRSLYERVFDGGALGTFWPGSSGPCFRIAVHLREGDQFITHAIFNKNDSRVYDKDAMLLALKNVVDVAKRIAPPGSKLVTFGCGDTMQAREQLRMVLTEHFLVVSAPESPVHIGYRAILDIFGTEHAGRAARDTVREHHTLASADAIFMLSYSGFSLSACSIGAAGGRVNASLPRCFVHTDRGNWEQTDPVKINMLSPGT